MARRLITTYSYPPSNIHIKPKKRHIRECPWCGYPHRLKAFALQPDKWEGMDPEYVAICSQTERPLFLTDRRVTN